MNYNKKKASYVYNLPFFVTNGVGFCKNLFLDIVNLSKELEKKVFNFDMHCNLC